jgi:hypothetical protein
MQQAELDRVRTEKAKACQELADATAALDKVTASLRDLPKLEMPADSTKKLSAPRSSSGWVAALSSKPRQRRIKSAHDAVSL